MKIYKNCNDKMRWVEMKRVYHRLVFELPPRLSDYDYLLDAMHYSIC